MFSLKNNSNWKGGKTKYSDGYIVIKDPLHPFSDKNGYVREHRLIVEKSLNRFLDPQEVIHHINGKRDDNRLENLKLFKNDAEHNSFHFPKGKPVASNKAQIHR